MAVRAYTLKLLDHARAKLPQLHLHTSAITLFTTHASTTLATHARLKKDIAWQNVYFHLNGSSEQKNFNYVLTTETKSLKTGKHIAEFSSKFLSAVLSKSDERVSKACATFEVKKKTSRNQKGLNKTASIFSDRIITQKHKHFCSLQILCNVDFCIEL